MIKATGRRWSTEYKEPVIAVLVQAGARAMRGGPASGPQRAVACPSRGTRSRARAGRDALPVGRADSGPWRRTAAPPSQDCVISTTINGRPHTLTVPANTHAARPAARPPGPDGHQVRLRNRRVRRLHGPARRPAGELLPGAGPADRRARSADGGGPGAGRQAAPACRSRSWTTTPSTAASARRAC